MKNVFYVFILLLCCNCKPSTTNELTQNDFKTSFEKLILKEKNEGQTYLAKDLTEEEILEYKLTYIGNIQSQSENLEILFGTTYTGLYEDSKRAKSNIVIYDSNLERLGQYYVGGKFEELPIVENNNLKFVNKSSDCNETTSISFNDSIPKRIFIYCKGESGDFYNFEENK